MNNTVTTVCGYITLRINVNIHVISGVINVFTHCTLYLTDISLCGNNFLLYTLLLTYAIQLVSYGFHKTYIITLRLLLIRKYCV